MMEHIFSLSTDDIWRVARFLSPIQKSLMKERVKSIRIRVTLFGDGFVSGGGALVLFEREQPSDKGGLSRVPSRERERDPLTREGSAEEKAVFPGADAGR